MQHSDPPAPTDVSPVDPKPRALPRPHLALGPELLLETRRYMMMRQVLFGCACVLLLLHLIWPVAFDLGSILLLSGIYLLAVGSGGLEAARLSASGDQRRQERLAEDALRRAGRAQSHLEPGSATDEVSTRILASSDDPRRALILAGNEAEDALRAVYRHFSETERLAGTTSAAELPLQFMVQELIWRGLLAPDIYDTAEPILALREMAQGPRAQIRPQTAGDVARAAQTVVLRVQSLGVDIHPRKAPLTWMRPIAPDPGEATVTIDTEAQDRSGELNGTTEPPILVTEEEPLVPEPVGEDDAPSPLRFNRPARPIRGEMPYEEGGAPQTERLDHAPTKEPVAYEAPRREIRPLPGAVDPSDLPVS